MQQEIIPVLVRYSSGVTHLLKLNSDATYSSLQSNIAIPLENQRLFLDGRPFDSKSPFQLSPFLMFHALNNAKFITQGQVHLNIRFNKINHRSFIETIDANKSARDLLVSISEIIKIDACQLFLVWLGKPLDLYQPLSQCLLAHNSEVWCLHFELDCVRREFAQHHYIAENVMSINQLPGRETQSLASSVETDERTANMAIGSERSKQFPGQPHNQRAHMTKSQQMTPVDQCSQVQSPNIAKHLHGLDASRKGSRLSDDNMLIEPGKNDDSLLLSQGGGEKSRESHGRERIPSATGRQNDTAANSQIYMNPRISILDCFNITPDTHTIGEADHNLHRPPSILHENLVSQTTIEGQQTAKFVTSGGNVSLPNISQTNVPTIIEEEQTYNFEADPNYGNSTFDGFRKNYHQNQHARQNQHIQPQEEIYNVKILANSCDQKPDNLTLMQGQTKDELSSKDEDSLDLNQNEGNLEKSRQYQIQITQIPSDLDNSNNPRDPNLMAYSVFLDRSTVEAHHEAVAETEVRKYINRLSACMVEGLLRKEWEHLSDAEFNQKMNDELLQMMMKDGEDYENILAEIEAEDREKEKEKDHQKKNNQSKANGLNKGLTTNLLTIQHAQGQKKSKPKAEKYSVDKDDSKRPPKLEVTPKKPDSSIVSKSPRQILRPTTPKKQIPEDNLAKSHISSSGYGKVGPKSSKSQKSASNTGSVKQKNGDWQIKTDTIYKKPNVDKNPLSKSAVKDNSVAKSSLAKGTPKKTDIKQNKSLKGNQSSKVSKNTGKDSAVAAASIKLPKKDENLNEADSLDSSFTDIRKRTLNPDRSQKKNLNRSAEGKAVLNDLTGDRPKTALSPNSSKKAAPNTILNPKSDSGKKRSQKSVDSVQAEKKDPIIRKDKKANPVAQPASNTEIVHDDELNTLRPGDILFQLGQIKTSTQMLRQILADFVEGDIDHLLATDGTPVMEERLYDPLGSKKQDSHAISLL